MNKYIVGVLNVMAKSLKDMGLETIYLFLFGVVIFVLCVDITFFQTIY